MRVGILTFHNAINYGAVIQCYSLMKVLEQRGHDVEVVNYKIPSIERYREPFSFQALRRLRGSKNKLAYLLNNILLGRRRRIVVRAFDTFINNKLRLSKLYSIDKDISQSYDCIVFGSDQIWNLKLTNGFDPVLWGQIKKGNSLFVTYAASMGEIDSMSPQQWSSVADKLKAFDFISVRELTLKEYLSNKFNLNVDYCIDPTLLADSKILDDIAVKPKEDNYLYLYNVTKDKYAEAFALRLGSIIGCKVIKTDPKPRISLSNSCCVAEAISPEEFLGYIKYARLVVGNSFHVIALSLVFKKDFYSLDSYRPERIKSILKEIGLLERHISSKSIVERPQPIDYSLVEKKLMSMKNSSLAYISKVGL